MYGSRVILNMSSIFETLTTKQALSSILSNEEAMTWHQIRDT